MSIWVYSPHSWTNPSTLSSLHRKKALSSENRTDIERDSEKSYLASTRIRCVCIKYSEFPARWSRITSKWFNPKAEFTKVFLAYRTDLHTKNIWYANVIVTLLCWVFSVWNEIKPLDMEEWIQKDLQSQILLAETIQKMLPCTKTGYLSRNSISLQLQFSGRYTRRNKMHWSNQ